MSNPLKNGPFAAKLVKLNELDENVIDPLQYYSGREIGKFPKKTKLKKLEEVGTVKKPETRKYENEIPSNAVKLNYRHLEKETGFFRLKEFDKTKQEFKGKKLPMNSVIIGSMRPYLNNITVLDRNLLDKEIVTDSEWLIFHPYDNLIHFWFLILRSKFIGRQFVVTRGQTRPRLHKDILEKISVPILPDDIKKEFHNSQKKIMKKRIDLGRENEELSNSIENLIEN